MADRGPRVGRRDGARVDILKKILADKETMFRAGRLPADALLKAKLELCAAELDLCESDKERVSIYERIVDLRRQVEHVLQKEFDAAAIPEANLLKARADRLEAEVALERARAKAASEDKYRGKPRP